MNDVNRFVEIEIIYAKTCAASLRTFRDDQIKFTRITSDNPYSIDIWKILGVSEE